MENSKANYTTKRRKFTANQYTKHAVDVPQEEEAMSSSAKMAGGKRPPESIFVFIIFW